MGFILVPHSERATGHLTHFGLFGWNDLVSPKRVDIFVEDLSPEVVDLGDELQLERISRIPDGCDDEPVVVAGGHAQQQQIRVYPPAARLTVGSEEHPAIEIACVLMCP